MDDQQGQWLIHLEIVETSGTYKPAALETVLFKVDETSKSDKSDQSYDRFSEKPTIDESSPNIIKFHREPLKKICLCLAVLFRGSRRPDLKLSFSKKRSIGGFTGTTAFPLESLAPAEPESDKTPFAWAFSHRWFDAFVSSDSDEVLSWIAVHGSLELMKYVKAYSTESFKKLVEHRDKDGRTPLSLAAGAGQKSIVQLLVEAGAQIYSADNQNWTPMSWAGFLPVSKNNYDLLQFMCTLWETSGNSPTWWKLKHLHQAARFGSLYAVITFLMSAGIENVDDLLPDEATPFPNESIYHNKTVLCIAAEHGHSNIVQLLVQWHANVNFSTPDSNYTPLMLAINGDMNEYRKAEVVDILLIGGALISTKNAKGQTAEDLAIKNGLQSVRTRLDWRSKDGPAAERASQLDRNIDDLFLATVTSFETEGNRLRRFVPEQHRMSDLLERPEAEAKKIKDIAFKWIHLPANNMQWIEVLIAQLYKDKMQVYNILKPERWVRRQHHRGLNNSDESRVTSGVHHARFMRPMCQAFRCSRTQVPSKSNSASMDKDKYDTNLVLFMPYLHWDIMKQQVERERVMRQTLRSKEPERNWTSDQKLLNSYLFYRSPQSYSYVEEPMQPRLEPHYMHQPHARRTLDQYYYHGLNDTKERDRDQVLSRAPCQKQLHPDSKVLAMVDQLWLWVLAGKDGQPTTIVTCFPHREPRSNENFSGGNDATTDNAGDPDVFGDTNVLKQVLSYMLDYPQSVKTPYDLARLITMKCSRSYMDIGGQDERLRFKEMYEMAIGDVMRQETKLFDEFKAVMEATKKEEKTEVSLKERLKALLEVENSEKGYVEQNKASQADLTNRFKALLDELNDNSTTESVSSLVKLSGGKITQEKAQTLLKLAQFRVLDIRKEVQLLHEIKDVQDELRIMSMIFRDQKVIIQEMEEIMLSMPSKGTSVDQAISQEQKLEEAIQTENWGETETDRVREKTPVQNLDGKIEEAKRASSQDGNSVPVRANALSSMADSLESHIIGKQNSVLSPRAIVQLSINEIEVMVDGANNAYNALNLLIDLKQKQSNVMDARYARVQAEQSVKQGKTIMVFTIVTIVFLPLSFMAAFFTIDISQFKRVKDGKLSLGYVSEIMFPISAVVIASLIVIAFKIDSFEWLWTEKLPWWKRKKVKDVENSVHTTN